MPSCDQETLFFCNFRLLKIITVSPVMDFLKLKNQFPVPVLQTSPSTPNPPCKTSLHFIQSVTECHCYHLHQVETTCQEEWRVCSDVIQYTYMFGECMLRELELGHHLAGCVCVVDGSLWLRRGS